MAQDFSILVVDDDDITLRIIAQSLAQIAQIKTATNGVEALQSIEESKPDLVLLDMGLPDMNGLEVLSYIRKTHTQSELPVIIVTASISTQIESTVLMAGANDFIHKPVNHHVLLARIYTQQKLVERDSELRIAAIAFEAQEGMIVTDAHGVVLRVNKAFTTISGYTAQDAIGKTTKILQSGRHDKKFYTDMWSQLNINGNWEGEVWNRRKNGQIYPEYLAITAVKNSNGIVTNYVATFSDITMSKAAADEIRNLAFYDPLTQLPNRRLLLDRLKQALASSARSGKKGALIFIDLDNFKTLNDTLGHDIGDLLLQQVASRLISNIREEDTAARLGGDEFVLMLEDLSENAIDAAEQAEFIANKILTSLNQPYLLSLHQHRSTPSIGVSLFNDHDISVEDLLKQADIAMYEAKTAGRNTIRFFDPQMQEALNIRASLEAELHNALDQNEFELYYQIQMDKAGSPVGAEALLRWNHPQRGLLLPGQFIGLAEESGLIIPIGRWVLDTACAQIGKWQENDLTKEFVLSVNVSAKQFHQHDFVTQVEEIITRNRISAKLLKLELTESMLLNNVEETISTMNALQEFGVQFSLDDFGTGYSSLQYLKKLPIDQLKIDQSFVRDIVTDNSDKAIVSTVIVMAQSLSLNAIAEGVETEEQRQFLHENECTLFQGYLFGKPLPINQFNSTLIDIKKDSWRISN